MATSTIKEIGVEPRLEDPDLLNTGTIVQESLTIMTGEEEGIVPIDLRGQDHHAVGAGVHPIAAVITAAVVVVVLLVGDPITTTTGHGVRLGPESSPNLSFRGTKLVAVEPTYRRKSFSLADALIDRVTTCHLKTIRERLDHCSSGI